MIRSLKGWDAAFYAGRVQMCTVLRLKKHSDVAPIAELLAKKVLAFQIGTDGRILYKNPQKVPIYDVPHIEDNEKLSHFFLKRHTRPYKIALGAIGVNDDSIVFNCNHMVGDGGYMKFIIQELSNGRDTPLVGDYPRSAEYVFSREIAEAPDTSIPADYDMNLTNFISKDINGLNTDRFARLIITNFPAESLQCYNKEKKTLKGLTESIFSNFYAAVVAYSSDSYKCGIECCIDLRRFSKKDNWNENCNFSMLPVIASVSPNDKMQVVGKKIRTSLMKGLDDGSSFSFLKAVYEGKTGPGFRGNRLAVSNVGPIRIGGPLTDAYLGYSETELAMPHCLAIVSWSIIGNGKNDITFRLKYNSDKCSTREAQLISDSTIWAMQNIDTSHTLEQTVDEIRQFQNKWLREHKTNVIKLIDSPSHY